MPEEPLREEAAPPEKRPEEPKRETARHEEPKPETERREEPELARREEPEPARREEPKIDPRALLESSGLVMIETDRGKARSIVQVEEEPQRLGRPRRERSRPLPQEEELQQVETRK